MAFKRHIEHNVKYLHAFAGRKKTQQRTSIKDRMQRIGCKILIKTVRKNALLHIS